MKTLNAGTVPDRLAKHPLPHAASHRIVHFGLGQFAKAHLLDYTSRASGEGNPWRLTGVSLNSAGVRDQLASQDWRYTLTVQSKEGSSVQLMDLIDEVLFAKEDGQRLREVLIDPKTQIISLTVTEKGYCLGPTGGLDTTNPGVQQDLSNMDEPGTVIGWILWTIKKRLSLKRPPITVMALDNLNQNGKILKRQVLELAQRLAPGLIAHIEANICFPCSMVDRIVPAVTTAQVDAVAANLGVRDHACVLTEAFSQWALEDHFSSQRPAWEQAGALLCHEVAPFEQMKLRLLNGAHSAMAYIGCLGGYETVADCMADDVLRAYILNLLLREIKPEVAPPEGMDLTQYIDDLIERFRNPGLHHLCAQIAMDGSQKIPQRWLPVLARRLAKGESVAGLGFAISAWCKFVVQRVSGQERLHDPIEQKLKSIVAAHPVDPIGALIGQSGVFTPLSEQLLPVVREASAKIEDEGLVSALASIYPATV